MSIDLPIISNVCQLLEMLVSILKKYIPAAAMFCVVALVLFSSCKRGGIDYNISDIDKKVTEEKVNALANQNINLNMASSKSVEEGAKHFDSSAVRKYLNSAVANNDPVSIEITCRILGKYMREAAKFSEALRLHNQGLDAAKKIHDTLEITRAYNNLGTDFRRIGSYADATANHNLALQYANEYSGLKRGEYDAYKNKTVALNGLGNISLTMHYYDEADAFFREALNMEDSLKSPLGMAINYANIGSIFEHRGQFDSAEVYYRRSLEKNTLAKSQIGISLNNCAIGSLYEKEGRLEEAKNQYLNAYKLSYTLTDRWHWIPSAIALGNVSIKMNRLPDALRYLSEAEDVAEDIHSPEYLIEINNSLGEYYKKKEDYKSALACKEKSTFFSDSIVGDKEESSFLESRVKYERELREKDVSKLSFRNKIERRARIITTVLGGVIATLLIGLLLMARRLMRMQKKRADDLENLNNVKNRFFAIISHDLKNPVAAQQLTIQQIMDSSETIDRKLLKEQCELLLLSSDTELTLLQNLFKWTQIQMGRMPYHPTRFKLMSVVQSAKSLLTIPLDLKGLTLNIQISNDTILVTDRNIVETVLRNLISNAIKYSYRGGEIIIKEKTIGDKIAISIADCGVGISAEKLDTIFDYSKRPSVPGTEGELGSGIGLEVCKQMIEICGGTIFAEKREKGGSIFTFTVNQDVT